MNANDHIDHNIDRALSALRDAQPRSGLEGRILASLERRAAMPQAARLHFSAQLALWTATAAAIIAMASLAILHHNHDTFQKPVILSERSESKNPEIARAQTNTKPFSTTNLAQTSIEPKHRMAHRLAMQSPCAESGCGIHGDDVAMNATSTTPTDAQALADLHAPSHPAPPLPLTAQEKLFRRMLQYGSATQLAELDPIVRAKENADETTAFKAFFPDPPPLKQPLGDNE